MWTAIAVVVVILIILVGIVECKKCPYKKWLCYASSEDCRAILAAIPTGSGIFGRLRVLITRRARTDDAANTAEKSKSD